jgi:sugar fermentation stimulation protein A
MQLPQPLIRGRLERRYKRFFADVALESGERITAHCPNPGSMLGLAEPGLACLLSKSDNRKRKLAHTWELAEVGGGLVGINTAHPNRIVKEALAERLIPAFHDYPQARPEVRYGEKSRVDFLLQGEGLADLYLEVKNVHLSRQAGLAEFPDCVTARGARHLDELGNMVAAGHRAAMLFLVQRTDCDRFALARDLDPAYAEAFARARARGVAALALACTINEREIRLGEPVPILD